MVLERLVALQLVSLEGLVVLNILVALKALVVRDRLVSLEIQVALTACGVLGLWVDLMDLLLRPTLMNLILFDVNKVIVAYKVVEAVGRVWWC
jgi:hypothetical protein